MKTPMRVLVAYDGSEGAEFLSTVESYVEQPALAL